MAGDTGLEDADLDKVAGDIAADIVKEGRGEPETPPEETPVEVKTPVTAKVPAKTPGSEEPIAYPKSWKKDYEPHWGKFPREVQEYVSNVREKEYLDGLEQYKAGHTWATPVREVVEPYMPMINAAGVDAPTALKYLLNAHYQLVYADADAKHKFFANLARDYGIDITKIPQEAQAASTPAEKALRERLEKLEGSTTQFMSTQAAERRAGIDKEVAAFAADPKHPYFDECSDDIARLLRADPRLPLGDAYERAVWANPVTRAKEQTRISTENAEKQRKEAEERAQAAKKARATSARGKPVPKESTTPLGSMDETLRETLRDIQSR
jgi:hypothetical protein